MTKMRIRWLIGLLSVALFGLVAFQFYWISEVISVNKERFSRSVNDALNDVTARLAIQNGYDFLQTQAYLTPPPRRAFNDFSDSATLVNNEVDQLGSPTFGNPDAFRNFIKVTIDERTGAMDFQFDMTAWANGAQDYRMNNSRVDPRTRLQMERQMNRQIDMLKNSWINHLAGSDNLFERLNPIMLDTLVAQSLSDHNIDMDYNYGVVHKPSKSIKIKSADYGTSQDIIDSDLSVNLFPMDLIEKDYYLSIDFPNQKNYLMSQALLPLSASGLLMLIVIGCFTYAVLVILRQKKISEIKNDFINNMTHEFKTPIATVSLATEALQDDDIKSNRTIVDRYVQVIKDENKRLGLQVEKVLQIASLDKKDFKLKIEDADIHDIIEKALVNVNILVENRQGQISSQLLASKPVIQADKVHLTNIIYNLLDNANKYSPDAPDIHIRTDNISTGVIIKITDRGIGMDHEATQKIFDKFYRVSTGNVHDVKGFGLGLSYVKNIVDMHSGSISVKSEPGKGSTFKIYLPFEHG